MNATVTTTHYELGKGMTLEPVTDFYGRTMQPGDIIEWRGPYPHKSLITSKIENGRNVHFKCIHMDTLNRHGVDAHMIKREDDAKLWHTQHYYKVGQMDESRMTEFERAADAKAIDEKEKADESKRQSDARMARGLAFHARVFPWARSFIVAERIVDDSDIMTDYFAEHGEDMIVLAPSRHERNNFAEMRKAALAIPETKHLGPGCNEYTPCVIAATENTEKRVWKGTRSHWHDEMTEGEDGKRVTFSTLAEIDEWIAKQPIPETVDGIEFTWTVLEEKAEHREDYSGGNGLYLQIKRGASPWRVHKINSYGGSVTEKAIFALGGRVDHLEAKTQAQETDATGETLEGVQVTHNTEKDGVEIRFPSRPSDETLEELKAEGFRWSRFGKCWYTKHSAETMETARRICGM